MSKYIVFCDLDGVLADFDLWYWSTFSVWPRECKDDRELWGRINRYRIEERATWFNKLPQMRGAMQLMSFLDENFKWGILTATGKNQHTSIQEKAEWVANNVGDDIEVFFVPSGKDKAPYATDTSILIDDRMKAIGPWREAGGIGILHESAEKTIEELKKYV